MISSISGTEPRFASLLRGESRHVWDTVIIEGNDFIVAPTQGSIIPGWVMIIPKQHFLNFAQKSQTDASDPCATMRDVLGQLGSSRSAIWFEHGASQTGSEVGCGVDHAHIHLLLNSCFDIGNFLQAVISKSGAKWEKRSFDEAYRELDGEVQYYAFGNGETAFTSVGKSFGRQFFRKIIAELSGCTEEWDYNTFPHAQNVVATLSTIAPKAMQAA